VKTTFLTAALVLATFVEALADQEIPTKTYVTSRTPQPVEVDGILKESDWSKVEWGTDFTQREPNDGEQPSQKTAFKILYDDK